MPLLNTRTYKELVSACLTQVLSQGYTRGKVASAFFTEDDVTYSIAVSNVAPPSNKNYVLWLVDNPQNANHLKILIQVNGGYVSAYEYLATGVLPVTESGSTNASNVVNGISVNDSLLPAYQSFISAIPNWTKLMPYSVDMLPTTQTSTAVFVDPDVGNDANAGSMASPKKTLVAANWTGSISGWGPNMVLFLKRGSGVNGTPGIIMPVSDLPINLGTNRHMAAYGEGPKPIIRSLATNVAACVVGISGASGASQVSLTDIAIDVSDVSRRHGVMIQAYGANQPISGIRITGCEVFGTKTDNGSTRYNGFHVVGYDANQSSAYSDFYDIGLIACYAHDNAGHGFYVGGPIGKQVSGTWLGVDHIGCVSRNNGLGSDSHGFSSFASSRLLEWTATWTNASGNIYYVDMSAGSRYNKQIPDIEVIYARSAGGVTYRLSRATTATAPNTGEYGFDPSTQRLYVNLGGSPNSYTFNCCAIGPKGVRYFGCMSTETQYPGTTIYQEGHGFAWDDFSSYGVMQNCYSAKNEGHGISINKGASCQILESRLEFNKFAAISSVFGRGHKVSRCRIRNNGGHTVESGIVVMVGADELSTLNPLDNVVEYSYITGSSASQSAMIGPGSSTARFLQSYRNVIENCAPSSSTPAYSRVLHSGLLTL